MTGTIRLTTATEIITAVPALLGFHPAQRSVVGLLLSGREIAAIARTDAAATPADRAAVADGFAHRAQTNDATAMLLVVVADTRHAGAALRTVDAIRERLARDGVPVEKALYVPKIEAGMAWTDLDTQETGVCADPVTSTAHTATVVTGRVVEASREALSDRYTQGRTVSGDDLRQALAAARELGADNFARTVVTDLYAAVREGAAPDQVLAARVGILLPLHPRGRDAVLGLAVTHPAAARATMAAIANQLDGIARAEALTVAGYFAYVAGHWPDATAAFDAAREEIRANPANPPRLLVLLERALASGISPAQVLDLAHTGRLVASDLGVLLTDEQ